MKLHSPAIGVALAATICLAQPAIVRCAERFAPSTNTADGEWTLLTVAGTPPPRLSNHTAIYDPQGDRMIVFGGFAPTGATNRVWELTLSGTPTWTELLPDSNPPSRRAGHSAVYDPVGHRMIVYGPDPDTLWSLSLSSTPTWSTIATSGGPPTGGSHRDGSGIYDPVRNSIFFFGGNIGQWQISLSATPTWTQLAASGGPGNESRRAAIYDPVGDKIVVFPGDFSNNVSGLLLSGTPAWTELVPESPDSPVHRRNVGGVYDPVRDRMVIHGGAATSNSTELYDAWALSLSGAPAWTQLAPAGTWPGLIAHSMIYDPARDRAIAFGGYDGGETTYNNTWALTWGTPGPGWHALGTAGTPPGGRSAASAVFDPNHDQMLIFGGLNGAGSVTQDTWRLTLSGATPTWSSLGTTGGPPPARSEHSAVFDPFHDRMVIYGGYDGSGSVLNDIWALSLSGPPTWSQLAPTGTAPVARAKHAAVFDLANDRMIVMGGRDPAGRYLTHVGALDLAATPAWIPFPESGSIPSGRANHTLTYDAANHTAVLIGGYDGAAELNDAWTLSLSGGASPWTTLSPTGGPPAPRQGHSAVYEPTGSRIVMFGGSAGGSGLNDSWGLGLGSSPAWSPLGVVAPNGTTAPVSAFAGGPAIQSGTLPPTRSEQSAVYDPFRRRMLLFGGSSGAAAFDDVWEFDLPPSSPNAVPIDRGVHGLELSTRPNPFRGGVTIDLVLPSAGPMALAVYDLLGRRVRGLASGEFPAGALTLRWDGRADSGRPAPSGVYFVRFERGAVSGIARIVRLD